MGADTFDLERFVKAQEPIYDHVLAELRAGKKQTHWIWFIFPQLKGLGKSETAERYGISSAGEALAYLAHPVLGSRLRTCTEIVLTHAGKPLHTLFGSPDDMKFISSMTLFEEVAGDQSGIFSRALEKMTGGRRDGRTLDLLKRA